MTENDTDIRQLALKRQQRRLHNRATVEQLIETDNSSLGRRRSSTSETKGFTYDSRNGFSKKSFLSTMPVPILEDESRMGRLNIPPVVKCECNGVETYASINTSTSISTISRNLVEKLGVTDQIIPNGTAIFNPLGLLHPKVNGKVKYLDLTLGSWQQVSQFYVVDSSIPDITFGVDFLRKTQSIVNFEDFSLKIGGENGERIPFLSNRDVLALTRKSSSRNSNPESSHQSNLIF
ncbi:nuclear receptor-interacting protein 3-like isoform X1 [Tachypleus tridentatus]|uniref:nuclear receptor-interacting protein 3-like isoform X1 n=1 Tax=Tachypleus tridentatus TaxID=6853 RepID=UPI003FD495EF